MFFELAKDVSSSLPNIFARASSYSRSRCSAVLPDALDGSFVELVAEVEDGVEMGIGDIPLFDAVFVFKSFERSRRRIFSVGVGAVDC